MEFNIAKIRDKIRLFEKNGKIISTNFMTPVEIQEVKNILRNIPFCIKGGVEEAERNIVIIGAEDAEIEEFCSVIRIESYNEEFTHRNILGSVIGLGIKREMLGDIIVKDRICDIIVMREMKEYILNTLNKIGREKVKVYENSFEEILKYENEKIETNISVASLRLDAIISVAYGISREKSSNLIELEKVMINYTSCTNISKNVKENDLISVRGFGRIKIVQILGDTRKGRKRICIEKK